MKKKTIRLALLAILVLIMLTACGDTQPEAQQNNDQGETTIPTTTPTSEPTGTVTPTPESTPTSTPTPRPIPEGLMLPEGTELMYWFDGEDPTQTLYFGSQGNGSANPGNIGYESNRSILATNRADGWHGITLDIKNKDENGGYDIIGKQIFVSYMAYHESGEDALISLTSAFTKPDGSTDWPEAHRAAGTVPSGVWTQISGYIDIPSDISAPMFYWEATGTIDFYLDNITICFVTDSTVGDKYAPVSFIDSYEYKFEDGEIGLAARGSVQLAVVDGGHEGKALSVSARTENWNGAQISLPAAAYAGKTVTVALYVSHNEAENISIKASIEQEIAAAATYSTIASLDSVAAGEWVLLSGSTVIDSATTKVVIYFESDSPTASYSLDSLKLSFK